MCSTFSPSPLRGDDCMDAGDRAMQGAIAEGWGEGPVLPGILIEAFALGDSPASTHPSSVLTDTFSPMGRREVVRANAQRPASSMPLSWCRRRRRWRPPSRFAAGSSRARKPAKLSALTRPAATSSPSASSSSVRSNRVASSSSSKNSAPRSRSASATACARDDSRISCGSSPAETDVQTAMSRRGRRTIGVLRTGPPPPPLPARRRLQLIRPARHSSSSQLIE